MKNLVVLLFFVLSCNSSKAVPAAIPKPTCEAVTSCNVSDYLESNSAGQAKVASLVPTIVPGLNGKDGANGVDGKNGMDGAPGSKGDQGKPGLDGSQGPTGDKGDTGLANALVLMATRTLHPETSYPSEYQLVEERLVFLPYSIPVSYGKAGSTVSLFLGAVECTYRSHGNSAYRFYKCSNVNIKAMKPVSFTGTIRLVVNDIDQDCRDDDEETLQVTVAVQIQKP